MKKQTAINFIAQVVAFVVNLGVSFFLTPFIVENIGVEANGFVSLANNFIEYAQLFTVALNSMAGRFITIKVHQKNEEDANKYFTSVFFANLVLSIVFTIIFSFVVMFLENLFNISENLIIDIKILWSLIFANFIVTLLASNFSISTFITDRLDKSAICNVRGIVLKAIILIIYYKFFTPYTFYVGIALLVMGMNNLISNIIYKKQLVPKLKIKKEYFNFKYIKELISSGIWNSISKLSSILSSGLDLLITNIFVSSIAMGVFNISKTVSNLVLSLFGTLASIFAPQLTIAYAQKDFEGMKKQLISSVKMLGMFSSIPIAILIGFGTDFYRLWVPSQDAVLLEILTIITSFNLIFALPLEPLYNIFTVKNKIKTSSIALILFSICSITTVFIGLNFINDENTKIIYIATVGAFYNVLRLLTFLPIYGAKCLDFKKTTFYPVILRNFISVIVLSVLAIGINLLFNINTWIKLIIACIIIGVTGLLTNFMTLFNKTERLDFANNIKKYISKRSERV